MTSTTTGAPSPQEGNALLPCPFCGTHADATSYLTEGAVNCANPRCRAHITKRHETQGEDGTDAAIAAWNRRAGQSPTAHPEGIDERALRIAFDAGWQMGAVETDARPSLFPGRARVEEAMERDWQDIRSEVLERVEPAGQSPTAHPEGPQG